VINVAVNVFTRCRDNTEANTGISSGAEGLVGFSRDSSAGYGVRAYGSDYALTAPSDGVSSENVFVFSGNNNGTPVLASAATISFYSIGTSLSLEDLDTSVTDLMNRIRFALVTGENPAGLDPATIDYVLRGYDAGGTLA
jgi:hypothetical protein